MSQAVIPSCLSCLACLVGTAGVARADPIGGFVDDYSGLVRGLLDLYEASLDRAWLEWAGELQTRQDQLFWDPEHGGYFGAAGDDPSIRLRLKEGRTESIFPHRSLVKAFVLPLPTRLCSQ